MDQRKYLTFLLLVITSWMIMNQLMPAPKPPQGNQVAQAGGAKGEDKAAGDEAADDDEPADDEAAADGKDEAAADEKDGDKAADQQPPAANPAQAGAQPPAKPGELQIAQSKGETQYATIGSLNRDDGYRMLVTVTSKGAAIHRAELTSPRFTDSHDWSGYLGELELKDKADGVQVQVVGAGTPAAEAEIKSGDVIVGIGDGNGGAKVTKKSLQEALKQTQPRQEFTLQVQSGGGAPQPRKVTLTRRPLALLRPEIENYEMRGVEAPEDFVEHPSLLTTLTSLNGKPLTKSESKRLTKLLETGNWELASHDAKSATFSLEPVPGFVITKRVTIEPVPDSQREDPSYPGYHVQLDVEFHNTAAEKQSFAYRQDGPTGMPLEGWWYAHKISRSRWFKPAGLRDIIVRFENNSVTQFDCQAIVTGDVAAMDQGQALAYAGVDGQYFSAVMIPVRKSISDVWFDNVEAVVVGAKPEPRFATFANVTCRLTRAPIDLAPDGKHSDSYQVFIGPKRPSLLENYKAANDPLYTLSDIVYYGLALFGVVARTMLAILHFFYSIVGNYGIAIIMLTLLARMCMFPLSYKQTKNMARIQALKPEMDRINELYKNDMQKKSQATQELYRKHQINPLGGCLPVFMQLPVFMGLYRALMVDVELRQSPLFGHTIKWCSNLAAPDMLLNWSSWMPQFVQGLLGPYLNILPIITVSLFLVTQKMSMPAPTNEQAAMQQKMMKYMTVFMGIMFYKVASGLCLYFITSSLWGMAERKLLPKNQLAGVVDGGSSGALGLGGNRSGGGGSNGKPRSKKPRKVRPKK